MDQRGSDLEVRRVYAVHVGQGFVEQKLYVGAEVFFGGQEVGRPFYLVDVFDVGRDVA